MIDQIRRVIPRQSQRTGSVREPATDWRVTVKRRTIVAAVALGLWAIGIELRLVDLQVIARADLMARAERQQLSDHCRPRQTR